MQYKLETLGTSYTSRDLKRLEEYFTNNANEGYKFHSVFQVEEKGCLGLGKSSMVYIAVFVKE